MENNNTSAFVSTDQSFFDEGLVIHVGKQVEQDAIDQMVAAIAATYDAQGLSLAFAVERSIYYAPTMKLSYKAAFKFTQPDGTSHGQELEFDIRSNSLGDFFTARGAALNAFQWNILNGLRQQLENGKPASEVLDVMNQFITKFPRQFITKFPRLNNLGL